MDTTKSELLNLAYSSLKYMVEMGNSHWRPDETSSSFYTIVPEKGEERVNEKNTSFEFSINSGSDGTKLKYTFAVSVHKVFKTKTKGFFNSTVIDCSRYITRIRIRENTNWSSSDIETYYFDTEYQKVESIRDIQSKMFNLLMEEHTRKEKEKENQKINGFISEIKKAADKSTIRDEKINDILN